MNREETRAHIESMRLGLDARIAIMNAFVQGKEIEYIPKGSVAKWSVASTPTWDWDRFEYRVKRVPREIVLREIGDRFEFPNAFGDGPGDRYVMFREVLE